MAVMAMVGLSTMAVMTMVGVRSGEKTALWDMMAMIMTGEGEEGETWTVRTGQNRSAVT